MSRAAVVQGRDGMEAVRLQCPGLGGDKLWPLVFGDARSGVHSVLVLWLTFVLDLDVLRAFFVYFWCPMTSPQVQ